MAIRLIINLLKVFVYYMLLFALCRLIFLLYFSGQVIHEGLGSFPLSLWKARPLDTSTACYLLFIPLIFLFLGNFFAARFFIAALKGWLLFTSVVYIALAIVEIGVYQEVHVKLYFNLLSHLRHPDELFHSTSINLLLVIFSLVFLLAWLFNRLINKLFTLNKSLAQRMTWARGLSTFFVFAASATLFVLGCRGGIQPIPINEGEVYFSNSQCVNDATVNPLWNIGHSYIENKLVLNGDAYKVMSDEDAQKTVQGLFSTERDSTTYILKTRRPNVCILILESWSADVIESLGGYKGLTPNFEKIASEGYLFTKIKPAGHVSDQGVPAVLSGYPAMPIGSAINQPDKHLFLPCLNNELSAAGYNTSSFFFGGQLIYGNIKAYIYHNKFAEVIEQADLPASLPAGRLGIHDSLMLNIWRDSINHMKPPFFTCLFTLSTHSPFDEPTAQVIDWGGIERPYLNSVVYADRQLGRFFEDAKKQPWYDSTVFILVADHSHTTPFNRSFESPDFYHIPFLITGGAVKEEFRGKKYDRLGSQTDIASTLLHQMDLSSAKYKWSKNLLNPYTSSFAFYTFNEGFGFADSTGYVIWNKRHADRSENNAQSPSQKESLYKKGAAVLQCLMIDFLSNGNKKPDIAK